MGSLVLTHFEYAPTNPFGPCPYRDSIMHVCSIIRPSIDGPTSDEKKKKKVKIKYQNKLKDVNAIATIMLPTILLSFRNTPSKLSLLKKRDKTKLGCSAVARMGCVVRPTGVSFALPSSCALLARDSCSRPQRILRSRR